MITQGAKAPRLQTMLEIGAVFACRGLAALGGVALSASVARFAGADGLGRFTVVLGAVSLVAMLSRAGLDMSLMREVAASWSRKTAVDLAGMLWYSLGVTSVLAAVASGISAIVGQAFFSNWEGADLLSLMALAILPLALLAVVSGYLKGRRRASAASLLESGGLSLAASGVLWLLSLAGFAVGLGTAAVVFLVVTVAAAAAAVIWTLGDASRLAGSARRRARPVPSDRRRLHSGAPDFLLIAVAVYLTQAGSFVIVAPFIDDHALGLARAAERMSLLIGFALTAINPFIAPRIVHHAIRNESASLRRLVLGACGLSAALAGPVAFVLIVVPEWSLSLFGEGFGEAAPMLVVFAIAQLTSAVTGPCTMLLTMIGQERSFRRILVGSLMASIVASPLAACAFGPIGFALAYASVIVGRNAVFAWRSKIALAT